MRLKAKKVFQTVPLAIVPLYITVIIFHYTSGRFDSNVARKESNQDGKISSDTFNSVGWQERAPRSISDNGRDYDNSIDTSNIISDKSLDMSSRGNVFTTDDATATSKPNTVLNDIFISVKTSRNFHQSRLDVILKTWFMLARDQTWFFSDSDDEVYIEKTRGHVINTNCSSSHNRKALCCKMSVEFDTFLESNKRWFCHFDDDNYVNIPQLVKLLQNYNSQEDWYLGKPSIRAPLEIMNRDNISQKISFWFATGGAGFCTSRSLALRMMPIASGGKFISIGEKIRLPDDVTMGYIIEHMLRVKLTVIDQFHSHLEPMRFIKQDTFADQITFSYSTYQKEMNILQIDGFDLKLDPTRFLSIHCYLFPNFSFCPR